MKDWALIAVLLIVAVFLLLTLRGRTDWSGGWQFSFRDALSGVGGALKGMFGGVRVRLGALPVAPLVSPSPGR